MKKMFLASVIMGSLGFVQVASISAQRPSKEHHSISTQHLQLKLTSEYTRTGSKIRIMNSVTNGGTELGPIHVKWLSAGLVTSSDYILKPQETQPYSTEYFSSRPPWAFDAVHLPGVDHSVTVVARAGTTEFDAAAFVPPLRIIEAFGKPLLRLLNLVTNLKGIVELTSEVRKLPGSSGEFEYTYRIVNLSSQPLNLKWLSLPYEFDTGWETTVEPHGYWTKTLNQQGQPVEVVDFLVFNSTSLARLKRFRENEVKRQQMGGRVRWLNEVIGNDSAIIAPALVPAALAKKIQYAH